MKIVMLAVLSSMLISCGVGVEEQQAPAVRQDALGLSGDSSSDGSGSGTTEKGADAGTGTKHNGPYLDWQLHDVIVSGIQ